MAMLLILLSFDAIYALIPLIVIAILILAAAGITRGKDLFTVLGFGTLTGLAGSQGGAAGKGLGRQRVNLGAVANPKTGIAATMMVATKIAQQHAKKKAEGNTVKKGMETEFLQQDKAIKAAYAPGQPGGIHPELRVRLSTNYNTINDKLYAKQQNAETKLNALSGQNVRDIKSEIKKKKEAGKTVLAVAPFRVLGPNSVAKEKLDRLETAELKAQNKHLRNLAKTLYKNYNKLYANTFLVNPAYASPRIAPSLNYTNTPRVANPNRRTPLPFALPTAKPSSILNEKSRNQEVNRKFHANEKHVPKRYLLAAAVFTPTIVAATLWFPPTALALGGVGAAAAIRSKLKTKNAMNNAKKAEAAQAGPPKAPVSPAQSTQVNTPPSSQPHISNQEWLNLQKMRLQQNLQNVSNPDWLKQQARYQFRNVEIPNLTDPAWQSQQLASIKAGMSDIRKGLPFTQANIKGSYNAFKARHLNPLAEKAPYITAGGVGMSFAYGITAIGVSSLNPFIIGLGLSGAIIADKSARYAYQKDKARTRKAMNAVQSGSESKT